jgi:hypothetical protein
MTVLRCWYSVRYHTGVVLGGMNVQEFLENRNAFSQGDLLPHLGRWVAFSEDGRAILAAADTLDRLETELAENRIDPQSVHFEYIPGSDEDDILFSPEMKHEVSLPK